MTFSTKHQFGGDWTEQKLEALRRYLEAYNSVLKNQPFERLYIDGFAGTGYRAVGSVEGSEFQQSFLEESLGVDAERWMDGSASIALKSDPGFTRFVFIEKSAKHVKELNRLKGVFPRKDIRVLSGDANVRVREICNVVDWNRFRAVCFLDPYGMQVEWETVEAIKETKAIDLWLLVPMGDALTRMLPHSGNIPPGWGRRLDLFFGTPEWRNIIYHEPVLKKQQGLFPSIDEEQFMARQSLKGIESYFISRLDDLFPAVMAEPLRLHRPDGKWLFSLFFAVSSENERAQKIALRIAKHIKKLVEEKRHG